MRIMSAALPLALLALAIPASSVSAQEIDDAAIAHIAVTANQLDVTGAEQALEKSADPEVRQFAETMIRDHTGVIDQAAALAQRLGVTPKDNETSRALTAQASDVRARLAGLSGRAFDAAYAENEVAYHQNVITAVEKTLIPNTSNGELKKLLQTAVPVLQAHLEHARRMSRQLSGGR